MFGTAAFIASRVVLAYLFGETLSERVELNSSIHGLISLKEASFWTSIGRSPYTGSIYRGPPLLLLLCARTCTDLALQATLLCICDWVGSRLLWALSGRLLKLHHSRGMMQRFRTPAHRLQQSLWFCRFPRADQNCSLTVLVQPVSHTVKLRWLNSFTCKPHTHLKPLWSCIRECSSGRDWHSCCCIPVSS